MSEVSYKKPDQVRSVAVLGTGSVGASWIALFLAHGLEVVAFDPSSAASQRVNDFVTNAWPALRELGRTQEQTPPLNRIRFVDTPAEAARQADVIQENWRPSTKERGLTTVETSRSRPSQATPRKSKSSALGFFSRAR